MKKTISIILTLLLVASFCFTGCGSKEEASKGSKSSETTKEGTKEVVKEGIKAYEGNLPLTNETITLTGILPATGWVPDVETNRLNMFLEESTNVHIKWTETSKEQYKDKLSIMISANECPDIIYGNMTKTDIEKYGMSGVIADVSHLYDNYAYYLKDVIDNRNPNGIKYMQASDGNRYFLPTFGGAYHMTRPFKYWMNQAWLDNLGLDMPTTTEEYRDVLRAFKTQDPNGNGLADEIPVTGSARNIEDTVSFLISSFIPAGMSGGKDSSVNNYTFIMDDKVTFTANQPEFKEGITYVKGLYEEGLLDPAAFTQNRDQVKPLVDGGEVNRIGGMASHHPGNFANIADVENGRFQEYKPMTPLKGPEGYSSTPYVYDSGMGFGMAISAKCEYPEIAFMWGDYHYKDEVSIKARLGFEGDHWEKPEDGVMALNGEQASFRPLVGQEIHEQNVLLGYAGPSYNAGFNEMHERPKGYSYEAMLFDATKNIMESHSVKVYPYKLLSIEEKELVEFEELKGIIHGYVTESVDRFIVGDLDIEKDWDDYLKQLEELKLERFMELLNKYYSN